MLKLYWNLWKFKFFFSQEKFYQYILFLLKNHKNQEEKIIHYFNFYQKRLPQYFYYNTYIVFLEFSIFYKKLNLAKTILNQKQFFYQGKGIEHKDNTQHSLFLKDLYYKHHPLWIILNCSHSFWQLLNHKDNSSQEHSYDDLLEFSQYIFQKLSISSFISEEKIKKIYEYCHPNQKILVDTLLLNLQLSSKPQISKKTAYKI